MSTADLPVIPVACGVLERDDGTVLLAQRPAGKIAAGKWEFPGGKIEGGEDVAAALARELHEELGVTIGASRPLIRFTYAYSDRVVILDTWRVTSWTGELQGREDQRFEWIAPSAAGTFDLLPTVQPILDALELPDDYVVTPPNADEAFLRDGLAHLPRGAWLRLRLPAMKDADYARVARQIVLDARPLGLRVITDRGAAQAIACGAYGIHVAEQGLALAKPGETRFKRIASCHDAASIARAGALGFAAAVVGPVEATNTHPGQVPLGWSAFETLASGTNLPLYAIGGIGPESKPVAWTHRARGVAGITAYWKKP